MDQSEIEKGRFGQALKGKIAVLIEEHFDATEFNQFNAFFPENGYQVEYISHLWGCPALHFASNPDDGVITSKVTVTTEVNDVNPSDYRGIILIGAYATDRLRYEANPQKGVANQAPAVQFLRKVMSQKVPVGTICHSLWLFCADPLLLKDKKVTCAHNIICDVQNAGGDVVFDGNQTAELVIDGNLITGKHPGMVDKFMVEFLKKL